jgi:hypothetical protein
MNSSRPATPGLRRRIAALLVLQERLDEACAAVTAGALSSEDLGLT